MTKMTKRTQLNETLEMSLSETSLIVRTINMLEKASPSIYTVGELLGTSVEDLMQIPNFGHKSLIQIYVALEEIGFERQFTPEEAAELSQEIKRQMPKTGTPLKETILTPPKEIMRLLLLNTKLPNESCALLATGGVLLVEDVIECSEETLLFLLGQDSTEFNAIASLIMLKRVLANMGL